MQRLDLREGPARMTILPTVRSGVGLRATYRGNAMDNSDELCDVPHELCDRMSDLRYVCEARGWADLLYLLDIVAHELKTRLAPPPEVHVEPTDMLA